MGRWGPTSESPERGEGPPRLKMDLIWLIPILPGLGAAINGLIGIRAFSRQTAGLVACATMAGALGLSILVGAVAGGRLVRPIGIPGVVRAGLVIQLFGFIALYAYVKDTREDRLAFWGVMLSIAGNGLFLPSTGILAFADPTIARLVQAGNSEALAISASGIESGVGGLILAALWFFAPKVIKT
mgnify:CR=1 FL=1